MQIKYLILAFMAISFLACRQSELKTETTTQVNKAFFKEKLQSSMSNCQLENDRLSYTSNTVFPNLQQATSSGKSTAQNTFQIDIGDTLFVKPIKKFKAFFVFDSTNGESFLFTYESQFRYSTFGMRKVIIDTGDLELECGK